MKKIWIILFVLLSSFFLLRYLIVGQAVYGDGLYYWAYTRSLYINHDLNFYNELGHKYSPENNNSISEEPLEQYQHTEPTKNNAAANRYPPGAPLSWLPFFFLADRIQHGVQILGHSVPRSGYADTYQITVGLGNILFIIVGLHFLYEFLRSFFSKKIAFLTTISMLFGTHLFYYGSLDVVNSHPFSFMISSIYFYLWRITLRKRSIREWVLLGLLLGILTTTRTQDIVLGIIPAIELFLSLLKKRNTLTIELKKSALLFTGWFVGFLPQLIVWIVLYGTFWKSPYIADSSFRYFNPQILGVLFNFKTGLAYYSLLFLIGFIGLLLYRQKEKAILNIFVCTILLQVYVISIWSGWHQGESYGYRMLLSLTPAFAVGIGYYIQILSKKIRMSLLCAIISLFILYNFAMIVIFQLYIQENTYINGIRTEDIIIERVTSWFSL